ncbi:ABC transporter permease [Pseudomonas sp. GD03817]|jgi:lipopolysaccharide transport system permease protein|uniref:Transport permease protein n=1 Tax=Pseudomonas putida (strain DOT-T1E) TaxID=1196325 RepID=I7B1E1_PSEPT|nr:MULTISPECIES: ABC transporter permease [Pseudomonas]AFO48865.1 lipopolysaccharide ABC export system, permease p [Pseudomonas putida DOT-T1E]ANC82925.1 ABC transporter [Pseudomonas putida B6-2]ANI04879.1 ABC transporter [Pseudomonas putida SJTE-1]ELS0925899.1 ABC transporter permease [Pseudomonas putida]MCE0991730.1 ABC transporter permease [Pseudomonas alloputida]
MFGMIKGIWSYRGFIISSIKNEFISRFARSKLGGLWMIIHPLAQVAIYALILSNVLAAKLPGIDNKYAYALYLMAGILAWNLFAEIVSRCLTLFIEQGNIMKKMRFPRITLPVIVVGSCLLNNVLLFAAVMLVFSLLGHYPTLQILWLIPLVMIVVALSVGIGLVLGILNVFLRDVGQVVPIVLQVLFWFTPIVYMVNVIPEHLRATLSFNPMYPIVTAYHDVLLYAKAPDLSQAVVMIGISFGLLLLGLFLFRRSVPEMVDVL